MEVWGSPRGLIRVTLAPSLFSAALERLCVAAA